MDTLHGSLATFGLEEICTLVGRTARTGVLRVEAPPLVGRIFFVDGAITYGTTREQDGSVTDLYSFGARFERPVRERRGRKATTPWPQPLAELIQQQVVEVLVRLIRPGRGQFWFVDGVTTRAYEPGEQYPFDVEDLFAEAEERREEWRSIEALVPDGATRFRLRPELTEGVFEVTIDARSWEFLVAIGDGASVQELAERMLMFEFPAARKVADFVRQGLIVADDPSLIPAERTVLLTLERDLGDDLPRLAEEA